ncbi:MAG: helix-turn-helix transcriptional regulator [Oscillospiraceae bacterium]|nr:helix-turn-helix transcriptional regulator [Oscillospiraceae bacterium]
MDQMKIGEFIRELRKENGLTQEQLAEQLNVSRRTVSRWETGNNLPDLDVLIEMADCYDIELRELLDGERKSEEKPLKLEETVRKVAQYSNEDKLKVTQRMHLLFIGGVAAAVLYMVLLFSDHSDNFLGGLCLGIMFGMMIVGVIMTSKYAAKIKVCKMRLLHLL